MEEAHDPSLAEWTSPDEAPWHPIVQRSLVCVEHVGSVQNLERGVATLGGAAKIEKLLASSEKAQAKATLCLRPDNATAKRVLSNNVSTRNVLLELRVPRRTGRKRKRGSNDPWQHDEETVPASKSTSTGAQAAAGSTSATTSNSSSQSRVLWSDPRQVRQSVQDNAEHLRLRAVGSVEQTHRFRSMPDFVYSTQHSPFMTKIRQTIRPLKYSSAKSFDFDMNKSFKLNEDLLPPPTFSTMTQPHKYWYRPNPLSKAQVDEAGNVQLVVPREPRILTERLPYDCIEVPSGPTANVPPLESLDGPTQELAQQVLHLMQDRPIWTMRALTNQMRSTLWAQRSKIVRQYIGYEFRSGPWRDAFIKYGVDPRKDARYRIYQTMVFQFEGDRLGRKGKHHGRKRKDEPPSSMPSPSQVEPSPGQSHIWDGRKVGLDGKTWQVCDITEPLVRDLCANAAVRSACHISADGWYHNGVWAKARIITKAKMASLLSGRRQATATSDYARLLQMPDIINSETRSQTILPRGQYSAELVDWTALLRNMASTPEGESRRRRQSSTAATPALDGDTPMEGASNDDLVDEEDGGDGGTNEHVTRQSREHTDAATAFDQGLLDPRIRDAIASMQARASEEAQDDNLSDDASGPSNQSRASGQSSLGSNDDMDGVDGRNSIDAVDSERDDGVEEE